MQIGVSTNPKQNLMQEISWAAENGFELIDLYLAAPGAAIESTDWHAVQRAITDSGLAVVCQAASYLPLNNPVPGIRQAALDEVRRSIDAAKIVGASVLSVPFCGWPAHLTDALGYEYYRQLFEVILAHGAQRGVTIALENSAHNAHQLKYFREILQRVPKLMLHYNIGHGRVGTAQSLTREYLFAAADRLVHVHISDNDGERDSRLPFGAPGENAAGNSALNIAREMQTLHSFRYDGSITLDMGGDRRWVIACAQELRTVWGATA
ncbi:MAG: sugar phosphate isomerase/epimerase [Caldilineaceae bacterium]|nr:sugar phosphate isomerase/epimerase [Caldilineaceae bacterium]